MTEAEQGDQTDTGPWNLEAIATREGRWWSVRIPELGVSVRARNLREIPTVVAEIAAEALNDPNIAVKPDVTVRVSADAERLWAAAQEVEDDARTAQHRAADLRRQAVRVARADGYKLDAVAAAFGVTPARIQQLATSTRTVNL